MNFWEIQLRFEAYSLPSLSYFKSEYMSLARPHPIWSTCVSDPFEVHKAVVQARMLSGRYPTDQLTRHWTENQAGLCKLSTCTGMDNGSLEHILLFCPALNEARNNVAKLALDLPENNKEVLELVTKALDDKTEEEFRMQFLLDASSMPIVIRLCQIQGRKILETIFKISRSWCYSVHRSRMTQLGLFQFR